METTIEKNGHGTNGVGAAAPAVAASRAAEHCSPSIVALAAALAKAQSGFKEIPRTRTVVVRSEKGQYTFAYAPLDVVLAATMPALNANGLSLVSLPTGGRPLRLRTLLLHESGEFLAIEVDLPPADRPQALGSLLTYYRRYSIVSLLGVASEEDDDGNAAEGNVVEQKVDKPAAARQQQVTKSSHGNDRAQAAGEIKQQSAPPAEKPWMKRLQAAVAKLKLGEQFADAKGLKGKDREDAVRGYRLMYLSWCTGREVASTLALTDAEAATVIAKAEAGEMPS